MTARDTALSIAAVLVVGFAIYLFIAVRGRPSQVALERSAPARSQAPAPAAAPAAPAAPTAPAPAAPAVAIPAGHPATLSPAAPSLAGQDPPASGSGSDQIVGAKLDGLMSEANRAYDRGDYDSAKIIASRVLVSVPNNIRMLRVMVSASCMDGDAATAQVHYARLPASDQEQMRTRCARYGITFADTH